MKFFAFAITLMFVLGSMAVADSAITGVVSPEISGMEINNTPPPVDAMELLYEAGYLNDADIDFIWSIYNNPEEQDAGEIECFSIYLKMLFKAAGEAFFAYKLLKAGAEVVKWINAHGTDNNEHVLPPYHVPNPYGPQNE